MNVDRDNGKVVSMVLIRDYCGNPCYVKAGDKLPPMRHGEQGKEISAMWIEASHHGEFDLFNIAVQMTNGDRHYWNVKHIEFFELESE